MDKELLQAMPHCDAIPSLAIAFPLDSGTEDGGHDDQPQPQIEVRQLRAYNERPVQHSMTLRYFLRMLFIDRASFPAVSL
jgi:hypothetical protein